MSKPAVEGLVDAAAALRDAVGRLRFRAPVAYVYNPLEYAWEAHAAYLRRYGTGRKRVLFLGMNPGPFGMAQTGVPFGEVSAVRSWMGLQTPVGRPSREHPRRPVQGLDCPRSEVSGRRLWGLFAERFGSPDRFFAEHFVANYCPLVFMADTGANLTPDRLPAAELGPLYEACDAHLRRCVELLKPAWLVGVGGFAADRAQAALATARGTVQVGRVLHPSPASPAANRGWAEAATRELRSSGVWS
jgi:single-strand selective monofunctional uracil DNA glycosylase